MTPSFSRCGGADTDTLMPWSRYLQSRAKDAIKKNRPIAGIPMNRVAVEAGRNFSAD
eukprot:COSAG01_NODE_169_length_23159_cov_44.920035_12_plen_57_part_00